MTDKEIAEVIKTRLNELIETSARNRSRNILWLIIKNTLKGAGYWKNKERGNPYEGYKTMIRNRETQDN